MELKGLKNSTTIITALLLTAGLTIALTSSTSPAGSILEGEEPKSLADTENIEIQSSTSSGLQKGLQAYYRFDNVQASKGYSLEFDGTDDYLSIDDSSSVDNTFGSTFNFTLTAWVKMNEWEDWRGIQNKAGCGNWSCTTAGMWTYGDGIVGVIGIDESGNPPNSYVRAIHKPGLGEWHHAAAVGNGSHVKLYIDGDLKDSEKITDSIKSNLTTNNHPLVVGRRCAGCTESINGSIAKIQAFNRTLSSSEISNLYNSLPVSEKGKVLSVDLNDGPRNCDLTSSTHCLLDKYFYSNDAEAVSFNDNSLDTESGWEKETPINRPWGKDYSVNNNKARFFGGNHGSLNGFELGNSSTWKKGVIDSGSVGLDGNDSYISIPDGNSLQPTDEISVGIWVKQKGENNNSDGNSQMLVEKYFWGSWGLLQWGGVGNTVTWHVEFQDGNDTEVSTTTPLTADGEWHYLMGTYDGKQLKIYFDGELEDSTSYPDRQISTSGGNIWIGRHGNSPHHFWFNGSTDDLRIYNKALKEEEVKELSQKKNVEKNLVGRWNFEEGEGTEAYDTSRFERGGTFSSETVKTGNSDDYLRLRYGPDRWNFDSITVSAWIYPDTLPASSGSHSDGAHIAGRVGGVSGQADTSNTDDNWRIAVGNSKIGFYTDSEQNYDHNMYTPKILKEDKWQHITATYNATTSRKKLFVNGKLQTETVVSSSPPDPLHTNTNPVSIFGTRSWDSDQVFNGMIDELRIYNRTLSEDEVKKLALD